MSPSSEKTMLVIPRELMIRARIKALERGTNVSAVVRELLEKWIDQPEETEKKEKATKRKRK